METKFEKNMECINGIAFIDYNAKEMIVTELTTEAKEKMYELSAQDKDWKIKYDPIYSERCLVEGLRDAAKTILEESTMKKIIRWMRR